MDTKKIIIKFDQSSEMTVGGITKLQGLLKAKYMVSVIDNLNLEANPRSAKTGSVTDDIQKSIIDNHDLFPCKTKGILMASSKYEKLDRKRIELLPQNPEIEGILDGGHNTLAIGLYILQKAFVYADKTFPRGAKKWDEFKTLWEENRYLVDDYLEAVAKGGEISEEMNFLIPVEILVPKDINDITCMESFKNDLLEICAARNNNVQLPVSDKANKKGYYDSLKTCLEEENRQLSDRIEWKTNAGGDIKIQDLIALSWIPLNLITPVKDELGKTIEPVSPVKLYSGKGSCLAQFERLMGSDEVTMAVSPDYRREPKNPEVISAFRITARLPELYDYIFEQFPSLYNAAGGSYGRITAVKKLNEKRRKKSTPFLGTAVDTVSPEGFITPIVYGLTALVERPHEKNGEMVLSWKCDPKDFLEKNLGKIVKEYANHLSLCDWDPQKVGKAAQSYNNTLRTFEMALHGIL